MRRSTLAFAAATVLASAACSSGEVVVIMELEVPDPDQAGATQMRPLGDIEVQLLPFDRDLVFDSLAGVAPNPEPAIPPEVLEAQDSIAAAQERWQALETRWGTLRDRLQTISDQMAQFNPAETRYRQLFSEFSDTEGQYNTVERQKTAAFDRFIALQEATLEEVNQIRIQQDNWADEAFGEIDVVFLAKMEEAGIDMMSDTTNAEGMTDNTAGNFVGLSAGRYWVHARYELPFSELYWNVPIEVATGEPTVVRLTRENAQERPKL